MTITDGGVTFHAVEVRRDKRGRFHSRGRIRAEWRRFGGTYTINHPEFQVYIGR